MALQGGDGSERILTALGRPLGTALLRIVMVALGALVAAEIIERHYDPHEAVIAGTAGPSLAAREVLRGGHRNGHRGGHLGVGEGARLIYIHDGPHGGPSALTKP